MGAIENGSVRVNAVCPGLIDTPMVQELARDGAKVVGTGMQCFDRLAEAREVAEVVVFLLGREASFVNGSCYGVDAGWRA